MFTKICASFSSIEIFAGKWLPSWGPHFLVPLAIHWAVWLVLAGGM